MAWERWKDCWYPGTVTAVNPLTGQPQAATWTEADLARGVANARGLLAKGYPIPLCWVHDVDTVPRAASQLAADIAARNRETFGRIKDVRLHPDGYAEVLCTGDDDEDLKRLPKVRFVSAQIHPGWTDPDGQRWEGPVLTHVAAVNRPIQYRQKPFQLAADAAAGPLWLAADAYEGKPMAEDSGKKGEGAGGTVEGLSELIEALKGAGLTIPDEVKDLPSLTIAVKAGMRVDDEADKAKAAAATGTEGTPPPVAMSADVAAKMAALEQRLALSEGDRLRVRRDHTAARIQAAYQSGRADAATRNAWDAQLKGAVQLSADGTGKGEIPVQLAADLAAHEKLPAGSIWGGERQTAGKGGEAALPADATDPDEAELKKADEDADAYAAKRNKRQPA